VVDTNGAEVGAVESVDGSFLTIRTDRHQVRLPSASFTPSKGVLLFGMSRDQLNQAVDKSMEAFATSLVKGTAIYGQAGSLAGMIDDTDAEFLTVALPSGSKVRLPRSAVVRGAKGPTLGISSAELQQLAQRPG